MFGWLRVKWMQLWIIWCWVLDCCLDVFDGRNASRVVYSDSTVEIDGMVMVVHFQNAFKMCVV